MCRCLDVHHHFFTPRYVDEMASLGVTEPGGRGFPDWNFDEGIRTLDDHGIDTAILSVGPPGLPLPNDRRRRELARELNEDATAAADRHPGRYGLFAVLPLPDVDAAIEEAVYALDVLGADGIGVLSNHLGVYLGDPRFDPLFEELNRRAAVVFIHGTMYCGANPPNTPNAGSNLPLLPPPLFEIQFDSTRAVANLVASGTVSRCPNIRFIIAHAGSVVPFYAFRLRGARPDAAALLAKQVASSDLEEYDGYAATLRQANLDVVGSFYYDTAVSANPHSLGILREVVPASQILTGTDLPYAMGLSSQYYFYNMDKYSGLTREDMARNAMAILDRWRSRTALSTLPGGESAVLDSDAFRIATPHS